MEVERNKMERREEALTAGKNQECATQSKTTDSGERRGRGRQAVEAVVSAERREGHVEQVRAVRGCDVGTEGHPGRVTSPRRALRAASADETEAGIHYTTHQGRRRRDSRQQQIVLVFEPSAVLLANSCGQCQPLALLPGRGTALGDSGGSGASGARRGGRDKDRRIISGTVRRGGGEREGGGMGPHATPRIAASHPIARNDIGWRSKAHCVVVPAEKGGGGRTADTERTPLNTYSGNHAAHFYRAR